MLIVMLVVCVFVFVEPYIPNWGMFLLFCACSSYWFIQFIYGFVNNVQGKFVPLDYLIVQSIIKYVPIYYFYSDTNNFAQYEVLNWYAPTMGVWFGLQLVLIFLQWIFGSRLGIKCVINAKDKEENSYKYEE